MSPSQNPLPRRGKQPGDVSLRQVRQNLLRPGYRGNAEAVSRGGADARSARACVFQANDNGDYFPVWATCLGFEELTYLTLGKLVLIKNNMRDMALPLNFTSGMDLRKVVFYRTCENTPGCPLVSKKYNSTC